MTSRHEIDDLVDSLVGDRRLDSHKSVETDPLVAQSAVADDSTVFSTTVVEVFHVPPAPRREVITYNKEVQTTDDYEDTRNFSKEAESSTYVEVGTSNEETAEMAPTARLHTRILDKEEQQLENNLKQLELEAEQPNESYFSEQADQPSIDPNDTFQRSFFADSDSDEVDKAQDAVEVAKLASNESAGRAITSVDWSFKYSEIVAVSYTENNENAMAPKGLVLIWNLRSPKKPQFVLTAPSDILSVRFSSFNAKIVFGGGYNGQVFAWNLRSGSKPALTSPLTGAAHNQPIYSLEISGTRNANTLFSASTDGSLCTWSPDLLVNPLEKLALMSSPTTETAPTTLAVSPRDPTIFIVGTEEGIIYQGNRFNNAGRKAGLDSRGNYRGHSAPVTKIDIHPAKGSVNFSDYMISSGFDWTIHLWKIKQFTELHVSSSSSATNKEVVEPLLSFHKDDVVYDVSWSPNFSGIFGSVDGTGHLEIHDINADLDTPVARIKPSSASDNVLPTITSTASLNYLNRPLNKLCWDRTAGSRRVAVGGLDGVLTVFEINPKILSSAKADDWKATQATLLKLDS